MRRLLLAKILLAVVGVAACSSQTPHQEPAAVSQSESHPRPVITQRAPVPVQKQMEGRENVLRLVVTDEGFVPSVLRVQEGGRVRIHLQNEGNQEHNLVIPRWGIVARNMGPGEENYIEFTASQKGLWPFFSDTSGSSEARLRGTLQVE